MSHTTWAEIPELRPGRATRIRKLTLRLLVPLVFAAFLWWLDLHLAALLVVIAVVALTAISALSPALSRRIEHAMSRFGHVVGRAITLVLLTIVDLLVFTPVAFVMWLLRYDPLAPGIRPGEPSFWHAHVARAFPRRQFADERALWNRAGVMSARRRPILRVATAVGVIALLLLADLGAGWVYDEVSNETHGTAAVADDAFSPTTQPALRDSPWVHDVFEEQTSLIEKRDAYLGYRFGNKASKYTNIKNGVRKSYQPQGAAHPLQVWFFGASSLFGDGLRDDHTIPSEVARIAEADGVQLEVRNYGRPGTGMWQELQLFQQVLVTGDRPDVVVFYDGFNDLAWQMNVKISSEPYNIFDLAASGGAASTSGDTNATSSSSSSGTTLSDVLGAYWDQSASHHVYDALHDLIAGSGQKAVEFAKGVKPVGVAQTPAQIKTAADNAVSIQQRAASIATKLASSVGATAEFYWQPNVFTKKLLPEERAYRGLKGYQPDRWNPAIKEARAHLKNTPYVYLGDVLDSAKQPVLWDFVHTNEDGARLSAAAIYAHLQPTLVARLASAGGTP